MNDDCTVTVSRFTSVFPEIEPNSYIVGFTLKCKSSLRNVYKEAKILYRDLKSHGPNLTDEQIVQIAWSRLESHFKIWYRDLNKNNRVKGMTFSPSLSSS